MQAITLRKGCLALCRRIGGGVIQGGSGGGGRGVGEYDAEDTASRKMAVSWEEARAKERGRDAERQQRKTMVERVRPSGIYVSSLLL